MRPAYAILGLLVWPVLGRAEMLQFATPSDDRWQYPFNFNPGGRATASCFGSTADPNFTTFNDRDGIFLVAWRTDGQVPVGLPPAAYDVQVVRVTLTHLAGTSSARISWPIDLTPDEWHTMDFPITDVDAGQPLELFGVGFGPVHNSTTWTEGSTYVGGDDQAFSLRDPFPFMFQGTTATKVHVEDNVKDAFTPQPWAVGVPVGYLPGSQIDPFPVHFDVDVALSGGRVRAYFQEQLAAGRVFTAVTSLRLTSKQAASGYPTFYTKEGASLHPAARPPRLEIELTPTGDVNGNGRRDLVDAASMERCLDGPDLLPDAPAPLSMARCLFLFDFDEDGDVDLEDHAVFARRFP